MHHRSFRFKFLEIVIISCLVCSVLSYFRFQYRKITVKRLRECEHLKREKKQPKTNSALQNILLISIDFLTMAPKSQQFLHIHAK